MWSCIKIYSTGNHLQFIHIRNCTKWQHCQLCVLRKNSILLSVHKINGSSAHTVSWICDKIVIFSGAFACLFLLLRKGQSLFWKSTEQFAQVTKSLRLGIDEGIKISSTHGSSQFIWEMSQSKDIFLELFAHTCLKTNESCVVLKEVKVISSKGNDKVELNVPSYLSPSLHIPFICWI